MLEVPANRPNDSFEVQRMLTEGPAFDPSITVDAFHSRTRSRDQDDESECRCQWASSTSRGPKCDLIDRELLLNILTYPGVSDETITVISQVREGMLSRVR